MRGVPGLFRPALLGAVLAGGTPAPVPPGQDPINDAALKAAYVYHFLNLTRWPDAGSTLVFGIYGDSEVGRQLQATLPRRVGTRDVVFQRIPPEEAHPKACHAVFVPGAYQRDIPEILGRFGAHPTVSISDAPDFARNGGMIGFVVVGDKLRFDVNQRASASRGLQFSAKLLELARAINP
ncbi:MAG TPA: YfiR family protein [Holophagaceae bacterium]|nr:YfiR family protein [Holophagaceae bacterium]